MFKCDNYDEIKYFRYFCYSIVSLSCVGLYDFIMIVGMIS